MWTKDYKINRHSDETQTTTNSCLSNKKRKSYIYTRIGKFILPMRTWVGVCGCGWTCICTCIRCLYVHMKRWMSLHYHTKSTDGPSWVWIIFPVGKWPAISYSNPASFGHNTRKVRFTKPADRWPRLPHSPIHLSLFSFSLTLTAQSLNALLFLLLLSTRQQRKVNMKFTYRSPPAWREPGSPATVTTHIPSCSRSWKTNLHRTIRSACFFSLFSFHSLDILPNTQLFSSN